MAVFAGINVQNNTFGQLFPLLCATKIDDGGLGMSPRQIGVALSIAGVMAVLFQMTVFPWCYNRLGGRFCLRLVLGIYPILYFVRSPFSTTANEVTVRSIPSRPLETGSRKYIPVGMGKYHLGIIRANIGERFHTSDLRNIHHPSLPFPNRLGNCQWRQSSAGSILQVVRSIYRRTGVLSQSGSGKALDCVEIGTCRVRSHGVDSRMVSL
jgi:hypothetical protein